MFTFGAQPIPFFRSGIDQVDSWIMSIHNRVTPALFVSVSAALGIFQILGKPIHCTGSNEKLSGDFLDSYCWSLSTESNLIDQPTDFYPGLGPENGSKQVLHAYYQWNSLLLLALALFSKLPHYFWKVKEGGLLRILLPISKENLRSVQSSPDEPEGRKYCDRIGAYFRVNVFSRRHRLYGLWFVAGELLCLLCLAAIILTLHIFLDFQFLPYGVRFAAHMASSENGISPAMKVFPVLARCRLNRYGSSGTLESLDSICVLTVNEINQKVFIMIWLWLLLLLLATIASLVHRLMTILVGASRSRQIRGLTWQLNSKTRTALVKRMSFGDYIILQQLGKHFEPAFFAKVAEAVDRSLSPIHWQNPDFREMVN